MQASAALSLTGKCEPFKQWRIQPEPQSQYQHFLLSTFSTLHRTVTVSLFTELYWQNTIWWEPHSEYKQQQDVLSIVVRVRSNQPECVHLLSSLDKIFNCVLINCQFNIYSKLQCSSVITSEAAHCIEKVLGVLTDVDLHSVSEFHEFPGNQSRPGHDTVAGQSGASHHPQGRATKQVSLSLSHQSEDIDKLCSAAVQ